VRQAYLNPMRLESIVGDFVICDPVLGLTIGHTFIIVALFVVDL